MSQLKYLMDRDAITALKDGEIPIYTYAKDTLVRLAQCCGCVAIGTLPYKNLWTRKKPKAKWTEKQLIVVGYRKRTPTIPISRGLLSFNLDNKEKFFITWENS